MDNGSMRLIEAIMAVGVPENLECNCPKCSGGKPKYPEDFIDSVIKNTPIETRILLDRETVRIVVESMLQLLSIGEIEEER
jgi:hypothetical protein